MAPEGECDDWWDEANEDRAGSLVTGIARQINENQRWRRTSAERYAALFAGHPDGSGVVSSHALAGTPITTTRNVVRMGVNTVVPKASKHRPLPQAQTTSGDWKSNKRARKMTQYLDGIYDKKGIFETHWFMMYRDGAVFGDGHLKIEHMGHGINVERVMPWEYLVDSFDAREGKPRSSYHVHSIDLGVALVRYGKRRKGEKSDKPAMLRREALREAAVSTPDPNWDLDGQFSSTVKRVRVVHAWHICDDEGAHENINVAKHECNGRRCTAILGNEECLEYEAFDWDSDPIHTIAFERALMGVNGVGLARQLEGWQDKATNQTDKVDLAHRISGGVAIVSSSSSGIIETQFTNEGPVMHVSYDGGQPPQAFVLPVADQAVLQREREIPQDAMNEFGISMQSSMGIKHPGVNSGVAVEQLDEIEDEHWVPLGRQGEACSLKMARSFIRCMVEIAKEVGEDSTIVQVKMRDGYVNLRWSDVSLQDFQVRVFPASVLPQQVANRYEKLRGMFVDGIIDRMTFLQQLGAPDMAAEIDLVTAGRIAIDEMLEAVQDAETHEELETATQMAMPNSYLDFKWMQARAQQRLMKASLARAPEENLQALRDICDACETIKTQNEPAPMPMPAAPGAGAPMPGMTPPQPSMPMSTPLAPGGPMPMGNA